MNDSVSDPGEDGDAGRQLLLVDDDEIFRTRLAQAFLKRGLSVQVASDHGGALALAREQPFEMAVVDLKMPGPSGLQLIQDLRQLCPEIEVVMLTGYGSVATAVDAVRLGAVNYLNKPAHADMILAAFERGRQPPLNPPAADYVPPSLGRAEWDLIQRVLADCNGNISQAARLLGLHRRSLQRKLAKAPPKD